MRIVFSNKVMMNIPKVVSYMKNNMGCDYNTIQNIVKTMLGYVQDKINKDGSNYNHAYIYQSCWWSDGNSGIGWIYDYCSFPRQGFAVVYNMRYDQVKNILENAKPLKSIKSLIEKIEGKINIIKEDILTKAQVKKLDELRSKMSDYWDEYWEEYYRTINVSEHDIKELYKSYRYYVTLPNICPDFSSFQMWTISPTNLDKYPIFYP